MCTFKIGINLISKMTRIFGGCCALDIAVSSRYCAYVFVVIEDAGPRTETLSVW